jgi:hypothetical protein
MPQVASGRSRRARRNFVRRLCVYREVRVRKNVAAKSKKPHKPVAVSYDEKPRSRRLQRRHRICRPSPASLRASRVIMSTNAMTRDQTSRRNVLRFAVISGVARTLRPFARCAKKGGFGHWSPGPESLKVLSAGIAKSRRISFGASVPLLGCVAAAHAPKIKVFGQRCAHQQEQRYAPHDP